MSDLSKSVLTKIKQEKITPIPKWKILLQKQFIWALVIIAVLLGSVAVAISAHLWIMPIDEMPGNSAHFQLWSQLMRIPFIWIILLLFFLYVAYHNFLHTEDGYKWKTLQILGVSVAISFLFGGILLISGFAPWLNSQFVRHIPGYAKFGDMRGVVWMNPAAGRLAGQIIAIDKTRSIFTLKDLNGKVWSISYSNSLLSAVDLQQGEFIKVIGEQQNDSNFSAKELRPWEGRGQMRRLQGNGSHLRITK